MVWDIEEQPRKNRWILLNIVLSFLLRTKGVYSQRADVLCVSVGLTQHMYRITWVQVKICTTR